jgi:hypothetical protein
MPIVTLQISLEISFIRRNKEKSIVEKNWEKTRTIIEVNNY